MSRGYHSDNGRDNIEIDYPEDIEKLKEAIPEIRCFHDSVVQYLYTDFSSTWYCAGWMNDGLDPYIEEFRRYLLTDKQT